MAFSDGYAIHMVKINDLAGLTNRKTIFAISKNNLKKEKEK